MGLISLHSSIQDELSSFKRSNHSSIPEAKHTTDTHIPKSSLKKVTSIRNMKKVQQLNEHLTPHTLICRASYYARRLINIVRYPPPHAQSYTLSEPTLQWMLCRDRPSGWREGLVELFSETGFVSLSFNWILEFHIKHCNDNDLPSFAGISRIKLLCTEFTSMVPSGIPALCELTDIIRRVLLSIEFC
ncbi:hypothetical protein POM88_018404 [Heracleum sosnowskyi]|uniref:Uncharacterized protein n=1 Tax=Heracleum sosnowskyi TaxID=360622 RepID=A0AAD8MZ71_9APIA|nr:hypothetical protein POM88_018404 [Heracleum sosnowskyi]